MNLNNLLEAKSKVLYISMLVLGGFIGASFLLSIKFYFLWYKKVQVHLDELLKLRLEKARSKRKTGNGVASSNMQTGEVSSTKKNKTKHKKRNKN